MIGGEGFPVGHEDLFEYVSLDLRIHLHTDIVGGKAGNLIENGRSDREQNHGCKGLNQFSGGVSGDDIHEIAGEQAREQTDDRSGQTEHCVKEHMQQVAVGIGIDPFDLPPHFLQASLLNSFDVKSYFFSHVKTKYLSG